MCDVRRLLARSCGREAVRYLTETGLAAREAESGDVHGAPEVL